MFWLVPGLLLLGGCVLLWRASGHFEPGDDGRSGPSSIHVTETQLAQVRQEKGRPYIGPDSSRTRRQPRR